MSFGASLRRHYVAEWAHFYFDYDAANFLYKKASTRWQNGEQDAFAELLDILTRHILTGDQFLYHQQYVVTQDCNHDLSRFRASARSVREILTNLNVKEEADLLDSRLKAIRSLEKLLCYCRVNQESYEQILGKLYSVSSFVPGLPECFNLYMRSFKTAYDNLISGIEFFEDEAARIQQEPLENKSASSDERMRDITDHDRADIDYSHEPILREMHCSILLNSSSGLDSLIHGGAPIPPTLSELSIALKLSLMNGSIACTEYLCAMLVEKAGIQSLEIDHETVLHRLVIDFTLTVSRQEKEVQPGNNRFSRRLRRGHPYLTFDKLKFLGLLGRLVRRYPELVARKDFQGRLPLHYAAETGSSVLCELLLDKVENPDSLFTYDSGGLTPLHLITIYGSSTAMRSVAHFLVLKPDGEAVASQTPILWNCLTIAIKNESLDIVEIMTMHGVKADFQDGQGETPLHHAARIDSADLMRILLLSSSISNVLDLPDQRLARTPLAIACIEGHLSLVEMLVRHGAVPDVVDSMGWTPKDHATFRSHTKIAEFLSSLSRQSKSLLTPSTPVLSASTPHDYPTIPMFHDDKTAIDEATILVMLGTTNTRNPVAAVTWSGATSKQVQPRRSDFGHSLVVSAMGAAGVSRDYHLPILRNLTNEPLCFSAKQPQNVQLRFEIVDKRDRRTRSYGVAILGHLNSAIGTSHQSLYRDFTVPLTDTTSFDCTGNVTFSLLVIKPSSVEMTEPPLPSGLWRGGGPGPQVVRHQGAGADIAGQSNLQTREKKARSSMTATKLGAKSFEFEVQLTKDLQPVIYHDFLVTAIGANIPLHTLTLDQFMRFDGLQRTGNELSAEAEMRQNGTRPLKRRRASSHGECDNATNVELMNGMSLSEEGNNVKGDIQGHSVHKKAATLQGILTELPEDIAFNLVIKHPMLSEAEDRHMDCYAFEFNLYVDTILKVVKQHKGKRSITFSSFNPGICVMLKLKQRSHPVLFLGKIGIVPAGDIRAGSTQQAIRFAKTYGLTGIILPSHPLVRCPKLIAYAKSAGLVVGSYGKLNDDRIAALIQAKAGLDILIINEVRPISETLPSHQ